MNLYRNILVLSGLCIVVVTIALLFYFQSSDDQGKVMVPLVDERETIESVATNTETQAAPFEIGATDSNQKAETSTPVSTESEVALKPIALGTQPNTEISKTTPTIPETARFSGITMLKEHNTVRSGVGIGDLTWSENLAASAQKWSVQLKSEGCKMRHDPNTPFGENLYWSWSSDARGGDLISSPKQVVDFWAAEEEFYNYTKNTCEAGEQCGHYTQIVWESSTEVGCGVSSCSDGDTQTDIWVCRYNPPGNDGSQPF